jgi:hypothetical protein
VASIFRRKPHPSSQHIPLMSHPLDAPECQSTTAEFATNRGTRVHTMLVLTHSLSLKRKGNESTIALYELETMTKTQRSRGKSSSHGSMEQITVVGLASVAIRGAFRQDTRHEYDSIVEFLHLPPHTLRNLKEEHVTVQKSTPKTSNIRRQLQELYAPYNNRLCMLLGWDKRCVIESRLL